MVAVGVAVASASRADEGYFAFTTHGSPGAEGTGGTASPRAGAPSPRVGAPSPPAPASSPAASSSGAASQRAQPGSVALPRLSLAQMAGQRVIYSYHGLTPPAALLQLISHGEAAGVLFFGPNVSSQAQIAKVIAELEQANASPLNPARAPLPLTTHPNAGILRRMPGAPFLSERPIGQAAR